MHQPLLRPVALSVNGRDVECEAPAHATLAELLRQHCGLASVKVACNQAACGACTVVVDGEAVFACHLLAAQAAGAAVTTVEALAAADGTLHPLQQAFVDHDAMQCGYCTPGMLMSLQAALAAGARSRDELTAAIAGNVCRCGAYAQIVDAASEVALGALLGRGR